MGKSKVDATVGTANAEDSSVMQDMSSLEQKIAKFFDSLAGKTEIELRNLYDDALVAESDAKRELYVLRQRAAALATDVDAEAERIIIEAKSGVEDAIAWLKALEQRLSGKLKDHNTGENFE